MGGRRPDDTGSTCDTQGGTGRPARPSAPGSRVRFSVESAASHDFSLLKGYLAFDFGSCVGSGGQGRVSRVRLSDDPDTVYALKEYGSRTAARREWEMLYAHRDELALPRPLLFGRFEEEGTSEAQRTERWAIVMEFIEGQALSTLLDDEDAQASITVERALDIMAPVMDWLSHSCRRSRRHDVHRDVKPHNIILQPDGTTRLIDFGIASNAGLHSVQRGTRGYAAPELYGADAAADFNDPRIDTYGEAATLYALLRAGRPPAYGISPAAIADGPLRHDTELAGRLMERLGKRLAEVFGVQLSDSNLRHAIESTIREEDLQLLGILARGLDTCQKRRPDPAQFESYLRPYLGPHAYEDTVFQRSIERALQVSQRAEELAFAAHVGERGDRDFLDALDAFNRGMYDEALPILRKQSDLKNTSAMYYYGVCIRDGLGHVERSYERAAALFSEAALQGNLLAQNALASMLLTGDGVPRNEEKAIEWMREAARDDEAAGRTGFKPARDWLEAHGIPL